MKIAVILCLAASIAACSPPAPVAYFDPQRVVADSAVARSAMEAASKSAASQLADAQRAAADVAAAEKTPIAADALKAKKDRATELADAYRKAVNDARAAAGAKLDETISTVLGKLASDRKLSLVLPLSGKLPYAAPGTDLTSEVVAALDGATGGELVRARAEAKAAAEKVKTLEAAAQAPPPGVRHVTASRSP